MFVTLRDCHDSSHTRLHTHAKSCSVQCARVNIRIPGYCVCACVCVLFPLSFSAAAASAAAAAAGASCECTEPIVLSVY